MKDHTVLRPLRRRIERLGPYPALLLVAIPLAIVEPLKIAILFLAGKGHWITGTIAMICAYAVSLFVSHWVFGIVKPKLLTVPWFGKTWKWFAAARRKIFEWLGAERNARVRRTRTPARDGIRAVPRRRAAAVAGSAKPQRARSRA